MWSFDRKVAFAIPWALWTLRSVFVDVRCVSGDICRKDLIGSWLDDGDDAAKVE